MQRDGVQWEELKRSTWRQHGDREEENDSLKEERCVCAMYGSKQVWMYGCKSGLLAILARWL